MKIEKDKDSRVTIVLDFDGVLHSYTSGWTGVKPEDPPVEGAQAFVMWLRAAGYRVVIQSTRAAAPGGPGFILEWLRAHRFPEFDACDITATKPNAVLYVDDRGFRFNGDFSEVQNKIVEGVDPWNKRAEGHEWRVLADFVCGKTVDRLVFEEDIGEGFNIVFDDGSTLGFDVLEGRLCWVCDDCPPEESGGDEEDS